MKSSPPCPPHSSKIQAPRVSYGTLASQTPSPAADVSFNLLSDSAVRPLVWFVVVLFGVQGFISPAFGVPNLACQYIEKDQLALSPEESTLLASLAGLPWTIKPIYG